LKIDVRIVYGKSELQPQEIEWLRGLTYIRTSFCKNLHAKCYMNENMCIVTSLNLYEFSQVNNNEMGVLIQRADDGQLYKDAYEEAQRIIRISDEVRISLERVATEPDTRATEEDKSADAESAGDKLTTSKIAQKLGLKTAQFLERATELGYLALSGDKHTLLPKGEQAGVEFVAKSRFGPYFLWPYAFNPA
jgi:phosphatidylserine/phosphatidylglycerophosphate/cardiolipin synthase-like enzyme